MGRGFSGCATCDWFFFRDQFTCVVGCGDTAIEEATYLSNIASKVYLTRRRDKFTAEPILLDKIMEKVAAGKIVLMLFKTLDEVLGNDGGVTGVKLKDTMSELVEEIPLTRCFISIGHEPNTLIFKGQMEIKHKYTVPKPGCKVLPR
jgi:thioredoxin reductase (NADPH)